MPYYPPAGASEPDTSGAWQTIKSWGPLARSSSNGTDVQFATSNGSTNSGSQMSATAGPDVLPVVGADHVLAGKEARLRISVAVLTNPTASLRTHTWSLREFAVSGAANTGIVTPGTIVASASVAAPAASAKLHIVSAEFALPADGLYIITGVTDLTMAASSWIGASVDIQRRWV